MMKLELTTHRRQGQAGFSLVELMIVVAIIGILASLAVPRFQTFEAKAKQSEAKTNLRQIYALQIAYQGENDEYWNGFGTWATSLPQIGFTISNPEKARYFYSTAADQTAFIVGAAAITNDSIRAGCGQQDIIFIGPGGSILPVYDCALAP